jgi:Flp pilus assembly protein TadG
VSSRPVKLRDERGQSLVIVVLFLIVLLGFAALVLDVGHAYLAQRRLQASVDAAALAGADGLPTVASATALANTYGAGGNNSPLGLSDVQMTVSTKCLANAPGCTPANAVVVSESAAVPTVFGKVLGINSFTVHATATACSPCSSKPLDVMLVLDRTGSMCTTDSGADDHPQCTDMENARNGLKTFLSYMDPTLDHVGFAVLPPAASQTDVCPYTAGPYASPNDNYVLVPLSSNYASSPGVLNMSSPLVSAIDCVQANGTTSYANALEAAQAELVKDGRPNTQKIIVFMSDGAANTGPTSYPQSSPYRATPCHQGIASSQAIQGARTIVYSVGYDVGHDICQGLNKNAAGKYVQGAEQPAISALQALQGIAGPGNFYNQPNAAQLNTIYASVAADILAGTSRLVDNS